MKNNNLIAFVLEACGVIVATVSLGYIHPSLGGCAFALGLISFGIAVEDGDG